MSGRVIVVGSVNVDLVARVDRLPAPGETVVGATFERHPGGKGANQATAAARLGSAVVFVGVVGNDALAEEARAALVAEGVDIGELAVRPGATGVALIVVDRTGENVIAVASGANALVDAPLVVDALARIRPGPGDVMVVGHEIPTASVRAALAGGRAAGARTILNPAPAAGLDRTTLALTDILVPNRIELGQIVDADDRRTGRTVFGGRSEGDLAWSAGRLLEANSEGPGVAEAIVVTVGASGALIVRPDLPATDIPVVAVEAIDTVGAGDTFVGALAAELVDGRALEVAARRAAVAAALSTTKAGARGGMPTRDELERALARDT